MSLLIQTSPVLLRTETFEIKLATTFAELDAAMRLRFEVFNLEMQEGLLSSWERGYDTDAYDAYCDHLIAKDLAGNKVVGTYRLLRQSSARRNIGFYSENEFDLTRLKGLPDGLMELGRSCVAHSHRSSGVIAHLWGAIVEYARRHDTRYLFGCASLHCSEPREVGHLWDYLRDHHLAPGRYRVDPVTRCRMETSEEAPSGYDPREVRRLSPVMKGCLRAGAVVCGPPAYDAEFGTSAVLMLMDLKKKWPTVTGIITAGSNNGGSRPGDRSPDATPAFPVSLMTTETITTPETTEIRDDCPVSDFLIGGLLYSILIRGQDHLDSEEGETDGDQT
ncbi:MAG TPA: GNAT family N-acyltransferase [Blastocatellia bacterium]|nr:GNAT family N-acyltransferase [Blastocatellia bacterium]